LWEARQRTHDPQEGMHTARQSSFLSALHGHDTGDPMVKANRKALPSKRLW